jgi:hypothetical protein
VAGILSPPLLYLPDSYDKEASVPTENIDVTVVVSGQPERLKVNIHQTLEHVVHEALQKSGNTGQAPAASELRLQA